MLIDLEQWKTYNYIIYVRNKSGLSNYKKDTFTVESKDASKSPIDEKNILESKIVILSHNAESITTNSTKIRFKWTDYSKAYIEYGTTKNYGTKTKWEESFKYKEHLQTITGLEPDTTYYYKINITDTDNLQKSAEWNFKTTGPTNVSSPVSTLPIEQPDEQTEQPQTPSTWGNGGTATFASITSKWLKNACYLDNDHYVAEFLYQNPNVCFWELDSSSKKVTEIKVPTPPSSAIQLPKPSGGDDTDALEKIINWNKGKSFIGQWTYKVKDLTINVAADIFNMPMIPVSSSQNGFVIIRADDVRIFNSPIDAKNSNSIYFWYYIDNGSDRAVIVGWGFENLKHTKNKNASAVIIRAADDFHIACNDFKNITNKATSDNYTARANSIWMYGDKTNSTSGWYIVNNYTEELQTDGKLNDAEFFTIQNYKTTSVGNPVKIFANRNLNAGKRLTKHQENNAKILSNYYYWRDKQWPLWQRTLYSVHNIQFSDNIIIRNNRIKIDADGRFDYVINMEQKWKSQPLDNIHFDCNDVELTDTIASSSNTQSYLIAAGSNGSWHGTTDLSSNAGAPTNSSASNNNFHWAGSVKYYYGFDDGVPSDGWKLNLDGNIFTIPYVTREYK